jgi:hypothetical protein
MAISAMMAKIPGWRKTGEQTRLKAYGKVRIYRRVEHGTNGT